VLVPHVKLEFSPFVFFRLKESIFVKVDDLFVRGRSVYWRFVNDPSEI